MSTVPLDLGLFRSLSDQIRGVLGSEPRGIRVRCGRPREAATGRAAWGASVSGEITIAPEANALRPCERLELIGHEFCHAFQQRAGSSHAVAGRHAPADELEHQAMIWGEALRRGVPLYDAGDREPLPARPDQRLNALWVGGQEIEDSGDLSSDLSGVLALIPAGPAWVRWAIGAKGFQFRFEDDPGCAAGVLGGLHATDILRLQTAQLLISPRRLFGLKGDGLDTLLTAESSGTSSGVADVVTQNGLLDGQKILQMNEKLEGLGINNELLFSELSLAGSVALWSIFDTPNYQDVQREASAFASERVVSVVEFADAFAFFMEIFKAYPSGSNTGQATAEFLWEFLSPSVLERLNAPEIGFPLKTEHARGLPARLTEIEEGLGFRTLASGIRQVGVDLVSRDEFKSPPASAVDAYLSRAERCLAGATLETAQYAQDGRTQSFAYNGQSGGAVTLELDSTGCVTLQSFQQPEQSGTSPDAEKSTGGAGSSDGAGAAAASG